MNPNSNSNPNACEHGWLYFKLYPGQYVDRADALIAAAADRVRAIQPAAPWFYLRYFDASGFHLRLRVQLADDGQGLLAARLQSELRAVLDRLPDMPANLHQPMVLPRGAKGDPLGALAAGKPASLLLDRYEPEYDKYGGARGTPLAELLFADSSRIALALLADERAGLYDRKGLATSLMQVCFEVFEPAPARRYFRQFSQFWLGGDTPAADDWRDRFFAKARALAASGVALLPEPGSLHPAAALRLDEWRDALRRTQASYVAAGRGVAARKDVLAFNFSHLMNNRLGLSALEEAYLATLLEYTHRAPVLETTP